MDQSKKRYYLVGQTYSIQSMSIKFSPKTQIRVLTRWYKIQPQTIESTRLRLEPNIVWKEFTHSAHYLKCFEIKCVFFDFVLTIDMRVQFYLPDMIPLMTPAWPDTRQCGQGERRLGMFIDCDPPPPESDVRWTRGCDLNPDIETTWRHKPYSPKPPGNTETDCWFIYKVLVHSLPVTFQWHRLDNYFHRKSLWQWSNGQINILIAACNNQPMGIPQVWRLTNERPRDKWRVLTRDMHGHKQSDGSFLAQGLMYSICRVTLSEPLIGTFLHSKLLIGFWVTYKCFQTCWHQHHEHYEAIKPGREGDCQ